MPLHATMDYQCYSYFPNAQRKPRVHFDMEYRLTDDDKDDYPELREEFWNAFLGALTTKQPLSIKQDVWTTSLQSSLIAYEAVPLIGKAAQAAYTDDKGQVKGFDANSFFHFTGRVNDWADADLSILQVKAVMMAKGVQWTERLWLDAWQQAHSAR